MASCEYPIQDRTQVPWPRYVATRVRSSSGILPTSLASGVVGQDSEPEGGARAPSGRSSSELDCSINYLPDELVVVALCAAPASTMPVSSALLRHASLIAEIRRWPGS